MSSHKINSLSDFPAQCYAVMDGKLCILTRGEKGWKRASISGENSVANQELAALKNKELGVTPEEARLLVTGAVMGWDAWITPIKKPSAFREVFEVEISRPDFSSGYLPTATVKLPATWVELNDALEKIRDTHGERSCRVDVWESRPENLMQIIPKDANLFELNHLAQRIATLDDYGVNAFEGLLMMDIVRTDYAPVPVERLINLTHSLADCQIVYEAHDDESLGKFYADNGFVTELEALPETVFKWLDYSEIGKEMRIAEGGVFTPSGYVVQNGKMSAEYSSDKLQKPAKPNYVFKLEIAMAPSGEEPNDEHIANLKLPATIDDIICALDKVGGGSLQDCVFYGFDSIVPQIGGELFSNMDNFKALNELAGQIQTLEGRGELTVYKAMLEAVPDDINLADALSLSYQADDFNILQEVIFPDDYARNELKKHDIPLSDDLYASINLYQYGEKLMAQDHVIATPYGMLLGLDGQTPEQCLNNSGEQEEMQMEPNF